MRQYIIVLNKIMINGLTRSSAFDIRHSQKKHVDKLKTIITSGSTLFSFNQESISHLRTSHKNHVCLLII